MKKKKIFSFAFLLIVLTIGLYIVYLYQDIRFIDKEIAANNWKNQMVSEKVRFDTTTGQFFKDVRYQDLEDLRYQYYAYKDEKNKNKKVVYSFVSDNIGTVEDLSLPYQFPYYD